MVLWDTPLTSTLDFKKCGDNIDSRQDEEYPQLYKDGTINHRVVV
jgi:hypothetical protein